MDRLRALKFFLEVAETQNFSLAGKALGVPASSVSRRIRDLESELGAELFYRTTRVVKLTELGALYLEHVRPAVRALEYADEVVSHHSDLPSGVIRITATPGYGRYRLMPALETFTERFPDAVIDIELTDHVTNLASNEVDLAIRSTAALPDRMVARKLADNQSVLVASPAYLERFGRPQTVADVRNHKTLLYRRPHGVLYWQAKTKTEWLDLRTTPAFISNEGQDLIDKALMGAGLALLPCWSAQEYLSEKKLIELPLSDGKLSISRNAGSGIYLLYHRPKYSLRKIREIVDFLLSELSAEDASDPAVSL